MIATASWNEVERHVMSLFEHYGEEKDYFLEYMESVKKYPVQEALKCFRDLVGQIPLREREKAYAVGLQGVQNKLSTTQGKEKKYTKKRTSR